MDYNQLDEQTKKAIEAYVAEEEEYLQECIAEGKRYYRKHTSTNRGELGNSYENYLMDAMKGKPEYADAFALWTLQDEKENIELKIESQKKVIEDARRILEEAPAKLEELIGSLNDVEARIQNAGSSIENEQGMSR